MVGSVSYKLTQTIDLIARGTKTVPLSKIFQVLATSIRPPKYRETSSLYQMGRLKMSHNFYIRQDGITLVKRLNLFASNLHEPLLDYSLHAVLVFERQKPKACMTVKCERSNNNEQLSTFTCERLR